MTRVALLVLGLAAGFLAAWVLRGPDAPARVAQRPAERASAEQAERPKRTAPDDRARPETRDQPAERESRVTTSSTREALRDVHKAKHEGQEPPADLLDAAADEVERAADRYREQMIRSLGGRLVWREDLRKKIGEIADSPLLLQGRTVRQLRLDPTSGRNRGSSLVDTALDPRAPVKGTEHVAHVRGGAVPPGQVFVVERIRVVATLASEQRGRVSHLGLEVLRDARWVWNGPPEPFEVELRGRAHISHGWEHEIKMDLRHGAASVELHGRLLRTAEALALPRAPFTLHSGDGILGGEPVLLQVFAEHGGGNPNTVTLDGRANMYLDGLTTNNLWSDTADLGKQRTSLAHVRGVGRLPAGKVFLVRRIEYRAWLNKRDGTHSGFAITVGGKQVVAITAEQEVNPTGAWTGEVAIRPGEEKRVALTASMHALAEAIIFGDLVDAGD
jgi:hypothetical protein